MTPTFILQEIIDPGLAFMARVIGPKPVTSDAARVMLLAIAGQEGDFQYRLQQPSHIAHSLWQFESGGGVKGVLNHAITGPWIRKICVALNLPNDQTNVYNIMSWNDHLAVAMARCLLFTDPDAVPTDQATGWNVYLRNWRPGKPRPAAWPANYTAALAAVKP